MDYSFLGSIFRCCIFVFRMHDYLCRYLFNFVLWCEGWLSLLSALAYNLNEPLDPFPFLGGC